jgi:polar amino acid transport system permease protein/cystine transport system permease protein
MVGFITSFIEHLPEFLPVLLAAAVNTLIVTAGALVVALVLGLVVALARVSPLRPVSILARIYIEIIRGTPAITQLFIIYFGLPAVGLQIDSIPAAIIGLGMNGAAYTAENYRAGIAAVHRGQIEASLSLGLTPIDAMRYVILPQAVRIVIPPLTNYSISLLKDSAIVQTIAVPEIMFYARSLVSKTYLSMEIYLLVAMIYLAMTLPMARLSRWLEQARQAWN